MAYLNGNQIFTIMRTSYLNVNEVIAEISRPNLLINSNFAINQRGKNSYYYNSSSDYNAKSNQYTVDRWIHYIDGIYTLTPIADGGITINHSSSSGQANVDFAQIIENGYALYNGKYLTGSISVNGQVYSGTYQVATGTKATINTVTGLSFKIECTNSNVLKAFFQILKGYTFTIDWVKLELGNQATMYTPPLMAEELPKCQRYYQKFSGNYSSFGSGFFQNATLAMVWVVPKMQMRTNPTITLNGKVYIWCVNHIAGGGIQSNAISSGAQVVTAGTYYIPFTVSGATTGDTVGACTFRDTTSNLEFDAEIY